MATEVFGREGELTAVDAMLVAARQGLAALVLAGEAGIGKTTVWREGVALAAERGFRILSCRASPSETRLSFTGLSDLLAPVEPAVFDALPDPQRRAVDAALLRTDLPGGAPNPRAIGTGVISLLARLAGKSPVAIAIDDMQWLDLPSARTLEFALRRVGSLPVAVLATLRVGERSSNELLTGDLDGKRRQLRLGPLSLAALYRIVERELGHGLPRPLLAKIERAVGGNPFYALEFARAIEARPSPAPTQELPIPETLRDLLDARLRRLPRQTRAALLRAAALAQPTLGIVDGAALASAEQAGIVRVHADGRIEFAHPLFAAAVYAAASHAQRRTLHAELAQVTGDIEERARHLMRACEPDASDEDIADVLHQAAEHALRRGAVESAAELDEEAARRTPAHRLDLRRQRSLRAARHHLKSGDHARSTALCREVLETTPPDAVRAEALVILAEIAAIQAPLSAIPLLEEAISYAGDDTALEAQMEVSIATVFGSLLDWPWADTHLVRAVELAEKTGVGTLIASARALKVLTGLFCGQGVDEAGLERALALEDFATEVPFQSRASLNASVVLAATGQVERACALLLNLRDQLIVRGDEADLPWVLVQLGGTKWIGGNLAEAATCANEAAHLAALSGADVFRAFALTLRASVHFTQGDLAGARTDAEATIALSQRIGWPVGMVQAHWSLALVAFAEGRMDEALTLIDPVATATEMVGVYEWPVSMWLPDAIEIFIATGDAERARRLTDALIAWGSKFDRAWPLAAGHRSRALIAATAGDLEGASAAAAEALAANERLAFPVERAHTLLVQGQLLRRRGERRAARMTLHRALEIFEQSQARLWIERTRAEIARIGVRRAAEDLTEGEERVAGLAAQGLTNPEIAARLFMSRRTVEANLARAYGKLGIHSRAELGAVMAKRAAGLA